MLFVRYENLKSYLRYYPITSILFVVNIVMFLVTLFNGGINNLTLAKYGGLINAEPYSEELWRYVSSIFLHGSLMHLVFNNFALVVFAPPLERMLGSWKYLILYILSGILGNVMSTVGYNMQDKLTLSIGASGAIYGVYGAFLYIALLKKDWMDDASRKTLYGLLVFNIIFSVSSPGINWLAHAGGLIGGFIIFAVMIRFLISRNQRNL
ncbi:rhomboid family intramembrane serine protease [Paenibacillus pini]|uniref:Rhomboid family protein n=1 Tax=Paenibacillus pini JCM 16418 TaxID=1236976 RepID=W7Y6G5_9BACL|nr:rhomboid family intramembrane serine protease [Paenibacillus pini]GAF06490.1 rhomboid family protein [Paenibacillus pini JCM 16418]